MTPKKSDGTVENASDYTIPREGRKRKRVAGVHTHDSAHQGETAPIPDTPEPEPPKPDPDPATDEKPDEPAKRSGSGSATALILTLLVVVVLPVGIWQMLKPRPTAFERFREETCGKLNELAASEKPSNDPNYWLFSAACRTLPDSQ